VVYQMLKPKAPSWFLYHYYALLKQASIPPLSLDFESFLDQPGAKI